MCVCVFNCIIYWAYLWACTRMLNMDIAGDFNCPKINWTSLTCPENDKTSTNLLDLTNDFHLHQAVREPTRGKNNLELFLTTNPSLIESMHTAYQASVTMTVSPY